jgi:NADH dehydrogenase [ubiquinone] 1 alpha subcomplex assembly factor 6
VRGPLTGRTPLPAGRSGGGPGVSPLAALVRQHDRDRFQTALFAPARHREALFALYAFNYEIARVRESVREPMLGRIRLQWWREAIETVYGGGAPRRHEVVPALTAAIRERALSRVYFDRLIDAREGDLDDDPPATMAALEAYALASSSGLIQLALEVLVAANPAARAAATEIGVAYALTGLIRAMPVHVAMGRRTIPDDVATEAGLDPDDYAARRATPALRRAVAALAAAAERRLDAARELRPDMPKAALPALLPGRIAAHTLRRLERAEYDPFRGAGEGDPLQSWRLAFAALSGRF